MIQLDNIEKVYKGNGISTTALNGVSLEIADGELIAIVGPSGSGKTTLLNIIGCMDTVSGGRYLCNDVEVSALKNRKIEKFRKDNISFVFQQFALLNDYTVYENIELPLRVKNLSKKARKKIVREVLEKLKIAELEKKYPTQISGGQQQRCAIARAIVAGGNVILADEPTGALDGMTGQEILDVLKELHQEGKTVIIVTHDMKIAEQTERIIHIEDGKIIEPPNISSASYISSMRPLSPADTSC
jgi:putative ABC transport system ATP-binding protein